MTGHSKEVRALKRHLRDLSLQRDALQKAITMVEALQRLSRSPHPRPRRGGEGAHKPAH